MSYNIEATLPLLAVATMPQLNWKPEEFASVAKMEPGQVYRRKSYVGLELQVEIERLY
jgi:hypothetical protein